MSRKWYVVQSYSGQENSVLEALERRVKTMNFEGKIYQILSPEEKYIETRRDKKTGQEVKVEKSRKLYPGYIFIEFEVEANNEVDDKAWFMVRNTPGVTGFLGSSGKGTKPTPVRQVEMDAILMKVGKLEKPKFNFAVGDNVEIIAGSFEGQTMTLTAVNEAKQEVTGLLGGMMSMTVNALEVKKI